VQYVFDLAEGDVDGGGGDETCVVFKVGKGG